MKNTVNTFQPDFDVKFITPDSGLVSYKNDVVRIEVKQTVEEMVNQWKIIVVPRDYESETAYEFIESMTYCEISFKKYNNNLTSVIRGFVTSVTKTFNIQNGIPERQIIIEGENYGKVIRIAQIHYLVGYDSIQIVTSSESKIPLLGAYHINTFSGQQNIAEIIGGVFNNLIIPNFENIKTFLANRSSNGGGGLKTVGQQYAETSLPSFEYFPYTPGLTLSNYNPPQNLTFVNPMAGAQEGTVYDFIKMYSNIPWNEIFVEDLPDYSQLNFRPVPFRDLNGKFIGGTDFQDTPSESRITNIDDEEIISYSLSRSDEDVINYFFTDCIYESSNSLPFELFCRMTLGYDYNKNQNPSAILGEFEVQVDGNPTQKITNKNANQLAFSRGELFGLRRKTFPNSSLSIKGPLDSKGQQEISYISPVTTTAQVLNQILVQAYDHNSVLENGSILISGREDIRAGMYVRLKTNRTKSTTHMYYVNSLIHIFVPYQNFTTQLSVTRGEGFLDYKVKNGSL